MELFSKSQNGVASLALSSFLVATIVLHLGSLTRVEAACNAANSRRLATAYALSLFDPAQFVSYVHQEQATLSSMTFRQCLEAVRNAYMTASVNQPNSQEVYATSMNIASQAGVPELGPKVADGLTQSQGNYYLAVEVLNQLSRVLAGNLDYTSTIMYESAAQQQALGEIMIISGVDPGFWARYQRVLFEVTRWYMEAISNSIQ
jgi:hypothetical protein